MNFTYCRQVYMAYKKEKSKRKVSKLLPDQSTKNIVENQKEEQTSATVLVYYQVIDSIYNIIYIRASLATWRIPLNSPKNT